MSCNRSSFVVFHLFVLLANIIAAHKVIPEIPPSATPVRVSLGSVKETDEAKSSSYDNTDGLSSELAINLAAPGDYLYPLNLRRNDLLISSSYTHIMGDSINPAGETRPLLPVNCYYTGTLDNHPNSLVAVSVCDGINGIMYINDTALYSIYAIRNAEAQSQNELNVFDQFQIGLERDHVIISESVSSQDIGNASSNTDEPQSSCQMVDVPKDPSTSSANINGIFDPPPIQPQSILPNNTNQTLELFIANDFQRYQQWGDELIEQSTLEIVNIVDAMYRRVPVFPEPYSLRVSIAGIFTATSPMWFPTNTSSVMGESLLTDFRQWRTNLRSNASMAGTPVATSDVAHLLSGRFLGTNSNPAPNSANLLGLAYVGTTCGGFGVGINYMSRSARIFNSATVLAHEIGHNMGSNHDGAGTNCTTPGFLMWPSTCLGCASPATNFSSCSASQMTQKFRSGLACLNNSPKLCGNGLIDPGEECDSGNAIMGSNCCTESCQLRRNAKCDRSNGQCCNATTCQYYPVGASCDTNNPFVIQDPVQAACNLPNICSGTSALCPNLISPNGTLCTHIPTNSRGVCYNGRCSSRASSCGGLANMVHNSTCDTLSSTLQQSPCRLVCANNLGGCSTVSNVNASDYLWCARTNSSILGECRSGVCLTPVSRISIGVPIISDILGGGVVDNALPIPIPSNMNPSKLEGSSIAVVMGSVGGGVFLIGAVGAAGWWIWGRAAVHKVTGAPTLDNLIS